MLSLLAVELGGAAKTILGIGGLIFVHELGHFVVGRLCNVKAEAFSIGFGPVLAKWKPGETEYRLSAIPLGGYVKFAGENPDERGDRDPRSFFAASYPRKVAIMLAGVTMNVIAAFVLFVAAFAKGVEATAPVIGEVTPDGTAVAAGLRAGDRILRIQGRRTLSYEDVLQDVGLSSGPIEIEVERDGRALPPFTVPTRRGPDGMSKIGVKSAQDPRAIVVLPGSAGEAAGLRALDEVVAVDGAPVAGIEAAWEASRGRAAEWTVRRDDADARVSLPASAWTIGALHSDEEAPGRVVVASAPQGPARAAGLPDRFRVVALDGEDVESYLHLALLVRTAGAAGREVALKWTPADGDAVAETRLRPVEAPTTSYHDLGIRRVPLVELVREPNIGRALVLGVDQTHRWVVRIFASLRSLVTGRVSAKGLLGPVKLSQATYGAAQSGWPYLFLFLGMISMNLAVLNVLPVPLLDGGQLALITAEKIRGKPLPERVLEIVQWSGLILLLSFMLFVVVNDLRNL